MSRAVELTRKIVVFLLNIIAYVFGIVNLIIPIHEYEWTKDPKLSNIVDSDAALVVLIISVMGIVCATIAYFLKRKSKAALVIYSIVMALIGYKLLQFISFA